MKTKNNKGSKLWITVSIVLLLICILLTATLGVLYVKKATPQRLLSKLGFHFPEETNWTLESWNSSLEQLDYDSDIVFFPEETNWTLESGNSSLEQLNYDSDIVFFPEETNWTLESWNSSLEQLDYDSDIVFIGDSLTRGENFQEYFPNKKIINLGISGDSLSGISKRAFIISELTPEMIFVEGGVNSLGSNSVDSLAAQYESMIAEIIANNPGDEVFIQSILPISNKNQAGELTNENIVKLNAKLQEIAERQGVTYIDVYSVYVLNGEMNPEYTKDGVHLKDKYKYLWLDVLAEYVNK